MRNIFYFILFSSILGYSQDKTLELINTLAKDVVSSQDGSYYLVENSLIDFKISDSLIIEPSKRDFYLKDKEFPNHLLSSYSPKKVSWNMYNFNNAHLVTINQSEQITDAVKDVFFVDTTINEGQLLKITSQIDLNTFIVKRDSGWNEKEIWNQVEKTWNEIPLWKKVCYWFSNPVFSEDYRYARVAVLEKKKCREIATTYIYKYKDNAWQKIAEFQNLRIEKSMSHFNCEDLIVSFKN